MAKKKVSLEDEVADACLNGEYVERLKRSEDHHSERAIRRAECIGVASALTAIDQNDEDLGEQNSADTAREEGLEHFKDYATQAFITVYAFLRRKQTPAQRRAADKQLAARKRVVPPGDAP